MKTAGALSVIASCLLMAQTAHAGARDAGEPLVILTEQGSKDAEDTAFFSSIRSLAAEIGIVGLPRFGGHPPSGGSNTPDSSR